MTQRPGVFGHRWTILGVLLVASVAAFMMAITVGVLLPSISADLSLSPTQQGILGSSAFVGNLVLALPLSWWTSQFRPKILTTVTLAAGAILMSVQAWSPTFLVLLVGRFGFGITTMAREPARALLMHQWFEPREFIVINSVYNALFGLVVGGGLAVTPFILTAFGDSWRTVLLAFASSIVVLILLWLVIGQEREADSEAQQRRGGQVELLKRVLRYKDLWLAGLGFTGATMGWSAFLNFYPTFMLSTGDVSLNWTGAILGLGILVGGLAGVGLSFAVMHLDAARRKNVLQLLGAIMAVTYFVMIRVDSIPLLLLVSALNGIGWGFWPILSSVPFYIPGIRPREVAIGTSLVMTLAALGTFMGPLVTGILQDRTGDLGLSLTVVCFAPLSLAVAGTVLRIRTDREG